MMPPLPIMLVRKNDADNDEFELDTTRAWLIRSQRRGEADPPSPSSIGGFCMLICDGARRRCAMPIFGLRRSIFKEEV